MAAGTRLASTTRASLGLSAIVQPFRGEYHRDAEGEHDPVRDVAYGWLGRLLNLPVRGPENHAEMMRLLTEEKGAIKVFVEVSGDD